MSEGSERSERQRATASGASREREEIPLDDVKRHAADVVAELYLAPLMVNYVATVRTIPQIEHTIHYYEGQIHSMQEKYLRLLYELEDCNENPHDMWVFIRLEAGIWIRHAQLHILHLHLNEVKADLQRRQTLFQAIEEQRRERERRQRELKEEQERIHRVRENEKRAHERQILAQRDHDHPPLYQLLPAFLNQHLAR